jgi:methylisocitrate lyase
MALTFMKHHYVSFETQYPLFCVTDVSHQGKGRHRTPQLSMPTDMQRRTPMINQGFLTEQNQRRLTPPRWHTTCTGKLNFHQETEMTQQSAGARFRQAVREEQPLQVIGAINANHALLAKRAGFKAIYLSGGGVAAGSLGLPDLGISGLDDVLTDVRRITDVCDTPLLVDVDTGFGASAFNIARTTRAMIKAGAAAMHIEDQVGAKRCGHRPGKAIVTQAEMVDRVRAAADARGSDDFVIMARTDALAVEGLQSAIDRACACVEAGADMIFPEAITDLNMYKQFVEAVKVPVLANITEFGSTPLFTTEELKGVGVGLVLYPLSAFRAMNKAAQAVYEAVRRDGTQKNVLDLMQTRMELYDSIGYHDFEQKLDALFAAGKK